MTNVQGLGRDFSWKELIMAYRYLRFLKRNPSMVVIPVKFKKLIKKLNKSKPDDFEKMAKSRESAKESICNLFKSSIAPPCGCMD